jgi:argininosuccinate lyase
MSLLIMMKGLPLAYNRDMQEDKKPLFEALDTATTSLRLMAGLVAGMSPRPESLSRSLQDGFITATDMADYLAAKGLPFREAHRITGEIVSMLISTHRRFSDLKLTDLKAFSALFEADVFVELDPASSVDRRTSYGGTARLNVRKALKEAHMVLESLAHED